MTQICPDRVIAERALVITLYIDVVATQFVTLTFLPAPTNLAPIHGDAGVARELLRAQRWLGFAIVAAALVLLGLRMKPGSPPLRRAIAPVLATGALTLVLAGATIIANELNAASAAGLNLAQIAAFGLMPAAFLAGLLRSRLARFGVAELVVELTAAPAPGQLRDNLARALGDQSLELAFWLPARAGFADPDGYPVQLPSPGSGRAVTQVESDGRPIAALIHDPALEQDPELIAGVSAAAALALEAERLQAELKAKIAELRTSRVRIVEAGDSERRRLERNLHDGAQQRLLALSFTLGLAETRLPAEPAQARTLVTGAKEDLGRAIDELRELAHGIHPQILTERGLAAAIDTLAARSPLPVSVWVPGERLPAPVEATAYYLVSEALANAAKHSRAHRIQVRLSRENMMVVIKVSDDGVGGADKAGSGLRGLVDRVEALDGRLYLAKSHARRSRRRLGPAARRPGAHPRRRRLRGHRPGRHRRGTPAEGPQLPAGHRDHRHPHAPGHSDEGIRAARQIRARHPQVAVLVLSQYVELRYALDLLSDGAERLGYLLKDRVSDVGEFRAAVRRIAEGGSAVDPAVIAQLVGRRRDHDPLADLTPREREVLELMAEDRSNQGIAARLVVTEHAVEKHIRNVFGKLHIDSGPEDHRRVLAVLTFLRSSAST